MGGPLEGVRRQKTPLVRIESLLPSAVSAGAEPCRRSHGRVVRKAKLRGRPRRPAPEFSSWRSTAAALPPPEGVEPGVEMSHF